MSSVRPVVVAYGAGVNSTALLLRMVELGERVDLVLFSDTGGERPETYAFADEMSHWLVAHGYPPVTTVRYRPATGDTTLEEECLRLGRLPSIAWRLAACSDKWKQRPALAFLREWAPAVDAWANGALVTKCIGYDADEPHRSGGRVSDPGFENRYPLIEWGWGREECVEAVTAAGLSSPGKSSCFFCPNMREREIVELQDKHPDLLARAFAIEEAAKAANHLGPRLRGLGRAHTWREILDGVGRQGDLFEMEMPCGCYDGGEP